MQNGKIKKLHLIRKLIKNKLDVSATQYSTAAKLLKTEIVKQQQLQAYKQRYNQDLFKSNNASVNINSVRQRVAFIAHIDNILNTQEVSIANMQRDTDAKKNIWLHFRNRFNKLSDYIAELEDMYFKSIEIKERSSMICMTTIKTWGCKS